MTWIAGRGRLDGPQKVRVLQPGEDGTPGKGGERILQATDVILATGSRVKSLPGLDAGRQADHHERRRPAARRRCPEDIVVVGAGAVGVEFASMFHDVGVEVTVLEYAPQIVPLEDVEVSKVVERSFTKRGITVMTNARFDATAVTADEHGVCLMVGPDGKDAAGAARRADARRHRPGREHRGHRPRDDAVETDRGIIKVNGRMRTREPHVYAIGDIVGGLWLAHTAGHEGITAAPRHRRRGGRPRWTTTPSRGRRTADRRSPRSG